jgi:hypothetical protein
MIEKMPEDLQRSDLEISHDDELADEFDSLVPEDPRYADWLETARRTGNTKLLRNRRAMQRVINDVLKQRFEHRIRTHIIQILKSSGGTKGMIEIMSLIDGIDGQAAANAAISLIFVMQEEGRVAIDFQKKDFDFNMAGERIQMTDEHIIVKLLPKR